MALVSGIFLPERNQVHVTLKTNSVCSSIIVETRPWAG
jgi:hypothetical protein